MSTNSCEAVKYRRHWREKVINLKGQAKQLASKTALSVLRYTTKDSPYKQHARKEFSAMGYVPLDEEQEDGPNKWFQEDMLDLLGILDLQEHSGGSIGFNANAFKKLALFNPLCPITGQDSEWGECFSNDDHYQNNRLSAVFKHGKDGNPYYIDAIVWRNEAGVNYTGSAFCGGESITSRQYIRLPFTPKTFYIDVMEKEVAEDDWEFYVKDATQLDEVFEYYDKYVKEI